jgi:hypothetical protein
MGKKKATRSRILRPIIEAAIKDGKIFVSERVSRTITTLAYNKYGEFKQTLECTNIEYTVAFVEDKKWHHDGDHIVLVTTLDDHGNIIFEFINNAHVLTNEAERWLKEELEQIIVMFRLGGYQAEKKEWHDF